VTEGNQVIPRGPSEFFQGPRLVLFMRRRVGKVRYSTAPLNNIADLPDQEAAVIAPRPFGDNHAQQLALGGRRSENKLRVRFSPVVETDVPQFILI